MAKIFEWSFTLILHQVKKQFSISADEYIYMDMIARQAAEFGGWTFVATKISAEVLGVNNLTISRYNSRLKVKGLLEVKDSEHGEVVGKRGSNLWWSAINNSQNKPVVDCNIVKCEENLKKFENNNFFQLIEHQSAPVQTEPKTPSVKFKKPSVEDVKLYCQNTNNLIDAQKFIDFYESKGWLIGKSPMKNWQAAVRNWATNNLKNNENQNKPYEKPNNAIPNAERVENYAEREKSNRTLGF